MKNNKAHSNVLHHIHKRKLASNVLEPYPHPDKFISYLDKVIFIIAIIGPLMAIPQLYNVWYLQDASGVSVISWFSWALMAGIWLLYGIVHKEKPIIMMNTLWVLFDFLIALGAIIYG